MRHCQRLCAILLLLAVCFALTLPAQAQRRPNTTGIYLNAHTSGNSAAYDFDNFDAFADDTDSGGGLGIQVGYGFSRLFTLFLGLNGAAMDSDDVQDAYTLAHVDLGAHLNFPSRSPAVPYGIVALSARQVHIEDRFGELDFNGGGLTLGGGLKYYLSRQVALDLSLAGTFGAFTEIDAGNATFELPNDIDATSVRFGIGVSIFPSPRRR